MESEGPHPHGLAIHPMREGGGKAALHLFRKKSQMLGNQKTGLKDSFVPEGW
ncbi:hypothetical protein CCACVL1_08301 [Corchorus capsularis]|uniref:Uncharacterized protein n=1 Tax=Corchorus capsularis TaxID=210143 RepID=A0A1R3J186_COCAP|nr:hypothetical protein CCACVL1_08301 [Corchorus capsularis]